MRSTDIFDKPTLFILVGIPGCGKSTWASLYLPYAVIVSSDAIRAELSHIHDQSRNSEVFDIFHDRISEELCYCNDVVADSTALDGFARRRLYKVAEECNANVSIVFFTNVYQGISRNAKRARKVPMEAMERMLDKYEMTLENLPEEVSQYEVIHSYMEISKFN